MATQVLLGCHQADPEDDSGSQVKPVVLPADLEKPSQLIGKWVETKGQKISLNADGTSELITMAAMGPSDPSGKTPKMEQKTPGTWGVKGEDFYFGGMKDAASLQYHWKLEGDKLKLSNNNFLLTYTKSKEK